MAAVNVVLVQYVPAPLTATAAGSVLTLIVLVEIQPVGNIYDMVVEPAAIPLTVPDDEPIVAIATLAELHVPVPDAFDSVVADPRQTLVAPVMPLDVPLTVTTIATPQPVPSE